MNKSSQKTNKQSKKLLSLKNFKKRKSISSLETSRRKEALTAYLFLSPALLGFLTFIVVPVIFVFCISFTEWNMMTGFAGMKFNGFSNYLRAFKDDAFKLAFKNNIYLSVLSVPLLVAISLMFASIVNKAVYFPNFIRGIFFTPYITTMTAVAVVFISLFNGNYGPINQMLRSFGIENPPGWLTDYRYAIIVIAIFWVWRLVGYFMVIYLGALKNVPITYYEAAEIDGASSIQKFFHITMPAVSPTTFFLLITGTIDSFKIFAQVDVITQGGPGGSTMVVIYYMYKRAFEFFEMGYAGAITWLFFIMVFTVTIIQWIGQKKWVKYDI